MFGTTAERLGEVFSVTKRLLRRELGLQTSRRVSVFFPAKGRILFEQATYATDYSKKIFTRRDKPNRIIGDPDNQLPDKWSHTLIRL